MKFLHKILSQCLRRGLSIRRTKALDERGAALMLAFFLSVVGIVLAVAATQLIVQSKKETLRRIQGTNESDAAARAGIVEALTWFRAQPNGVANNVSHTYAYHDEAFFPRQAIVAGTTQDQETLDESVGLVREFKIGNAGNGYQKWVRYEVRRQHWPLKDTRGLPYPSPTPNATSVVTPVAWDNYAAHDISGERILPKSGGAIENLPLNGDGNVWSIGSVGYVYLRPEATVGPVTFNQPPCRVVGKSAMVSEFRRVTMRGPWICGTSASVYTRYLNNVTLLKKGRVVMGDGDTGIAYLTKCSGGGTSCNYSYDERIAFNSATQKEYGPISGTCGVDPLVPTNIFGMSLTDLKKLADLSGDTVAEMYSVTGTPRSLPSDKLFFLDGNGTATFTFDNQNMFKGSGVLIVDGNLVVQNTSSTKPMSFHGLIYVTGNVTFEHNVTTDGALIALGKVTLSNAGAYTTTEVTFNKASLDDALINVMNFRENQSAVRLFTGLPPQ